MAIILPGSHLPVRVRNVGMILSETEMSTVLFVRDLLHHLGFIFKKYLVENHGSVKDSEIAGK